jgi:hypothetical protein
MVVSFLLRVTALLLVLGLCLSAGIAQDFALAVVG